MYSSSCLAKINNDENLNADNELEKAARFQVDRTKRESFELIKSSLKELDSLNNDAIEEFKSRASEIKDTALKHFRSKAKKKFADIYSHSEKSLMESIDERFEEISMRKLKQICKGHVEEFRNSLAEQAKVCKGMDEFKQFAAEQVEQETQKFRDTVKVLTLGESF